MIATLTRHRWGCLTVLLALGLAAAGWAAREPAAQALRAHPYFAISQLVIKGCGPALSADDVRAWVGIGADSTLWEMSPGRVRARLEEHPRIAQAAVRREFPGRLEVVVRERRPLAIAVLDELYYVDRSGALFGPLQAHDSRDYPFITGVDPNEPDGRRVWSLRRALRLLRRCAAGGCGSEISEVRVDAARGAVLYPAAPRPPLVLGWGSWPTKLARAEQALQTWRGNPERLASIDLRYRNQVVMRLHPPPAADPKPRPGKA
ncbi:MAG: cell division protein FtsQ/DivIB, partial [Candidatus Binatia bacterium]